MGITVSHCGTTQSGADIFLFMGPYDRLTSVIYELNKQKSYWDFCQEHDHWECDMILPETDTHGVTILDGIYGLVVTTHLHSFRLCLHPGWDDNSHRLVITLEQELGILRYGTRKELHTFRREVVGVSGILQLASKS